MPWMKDSTMLCLHNLMTIIMFLCHGIYDLFRHFKHLPIIQINLTFLCFHDQVLLLGCGDLKLPLITIVNSTQGKPLDLHVTDVNPAVIARHILILTVASSKNFDPENKEDLGYVWDLLYN